MLASARRHIRQQLIGYIALFFALGLGSAWAATELSKNEVKSRHIGKGQVKRSDLANDAVNSAKVGNGTLSAKDFAAGQLPSGAQGPKGAAGADNASAAADAELLDGLDSSAFERTGEVVYGVASPLVGSAEFFSIPEMGNPGDASTSTAPIPAGATQQVVLMVQDATAGDPSAAQRRLLLHCYFYVGSPNDCVGTRLTP